MPDGDLRLYLPARAPTRVQHVLHYSSGKDSTAAYLLGLEMGVAFRPVMFDTGNEEPISLDYAHNIGRLTGGPDVEVRRADFTHLFEARRAYIAEHWPAEGVSNEIVRRALSVMWPTGIPFLDLCLLKGRFPSARAQFCTEELKVKPCYEQVVRPMLRSGPVLQWMGVRAEESRRRALLPRFERDDSGAWIWRVIHRWTIDDVFEIHRRHGIEPNPLYKMGMGRVGCMPCINCTKDELREVAARFPAHIDKLREWESLVGFGSRLGGSSFFCSTDDPNYVSGPYGIDDTVAWSRTTRGGRQFDLLNAVALTDPDQCSSKYGLCS